MRFTLSLTFSLLLFRITTPTQAVLGQELSKGLRCSYHQLINGCCIHFAPPTHGGHQKGGRRLEKTNGCQWGRALGVYDGTLPVVCCVWVGWGLEWGRRPVKEKERCPSACGFAACPGVGDTAFLGRLMVGLDS